MYSGKKAQHDFPKMRGGGSKTVWNFSKNSSLLEMPSFPYSGQPDMIFVKFFTPAHFQNEKQLKTMKNNWKWWKTMKNDADWVSPTHFLQ